MGQADREDPQTHASIGVEGHGLSHLALGAHPAGFRLNTVEMGASYDLQPLRRAASRTEYIPFLPQNGLIDENAETETE
jgi:hypothetical protein